MSLELHARRLAAVKLANAVNKIEGAPVSTSAIALSNFKMRFIILHTQSQKLFSFIRFYISF